jgi:hypothetical protein
MIKNLNANVMITEQQVAFSSTGIKFGHREHMDNLLLSTAAMTRKKGKSSFSVTEVKKTHV